MKISVVTYNCFGSPVARDRNERFQKIAQELVHMRPDIICLQEVVFSRDARIIRDALRQVGYFVADTIGVFVNRGGLLFASLVPVQKFQFQYFSDQGKWVSQQITDRMMGKGYMRVELIVGNSIVTLFHAHVIAIYKPHSTGEQVSRKNQIMELARTVSQANGVNIVVGDLNMDPREGIFSEFMNVTQLVDSVSPEVLTFSKENTHANPMFGNDFNTRLDYVLHSQGLQANTHLVFTESMLVSGKHQHLADHFGLESVIQNKVQ